ncbi:MAG: GNAT family N-acetyltransferase [Nanoarchaeota archaeon]
MENINIRLADLSDLDRLVNYIHKNDGDPIMIKRNQLEYLIKSNFVIIAEDTNKNPGEIVGRVSFEAKEANPYLGVGEIEGVSISKDYQSKCIGTKIMWLAISEAQKFFEKYNAKCRFLFLYTRSSNAHAKALYKKFGFKEGALVGKMFKDNEPDEQMMYLKF